MKISIFELKEWEREPFEKLAEEHDVRMVSGSLTMESAAEHADAQVISTFIDSVISEEVLDRLGELELIATRSTGFDHVDVDACESRGIAVANAPSYGRNTVAEHAFALILSLFRHLSTSFQRTKSGDFSREGLLGSDLKGKTIGVVGTGDIGRETVRIARGFGMKVLAFDVVENEDLVREYDFSYVSLDELLSAADVVTLHVPANEKTERMIDAEAISKMKRTAVLINTSRGQVVDAIALHGALAQDRIAGAGLDVLEAERALGAEEEIHDLITAEGEKVQRLAADQALMRMENVVVTPHSAFFTAEAVERIATTTAENIGAWTSGQPQNLVVEAPLTAHSTTR